MGSPPSTPDYIRARRRGSRVLDSIEMKTTTGDSPDKPMDITAPTSSYSPLELNLDYPVFHILSDNRQVISIALLSLPLPYVSLSPGIYSIKEKKDDGSGIKCRYSI